MEAVVTHQFAEDCSSKVESLQTLEHLCLEEADII